ncbi:MAG TPA: acireductone synthase [Blastocatellia bacterium]|nr:acireductone synthase [Blastocatellia bacterium]
MTATPNDIAVSCVLLDIEGTTTPIDFVYQILFPYAREHARDYLTRHWSSEEVRDDLARLREERDADARQGNNPPAITEGLHEAAIESTVAYFHWLMDCDRKSTPLKSLQGKIWEEGYRSGELLSQVFDDVPRALERWRQQSKQVCIFSSGSVLAQKLLFGHTTAGDLTGFINAYFDTSVGAKADPESYRQISAGVGVPPSEFVFISDVIAELDAAHAAGMQTVLSVRPGNRPQPPSELHAAISTFNELLQ